MTTLGKTLFCVMLLGAGFALASLFGPPDLADRLAEKIVPGRSADPWGELRPASQPFEDSGGQSYFAQARTDGFAAPGSSLQPVAAPPAFSPTPGRESGTPGEPEWMAPQLDIAADDSGPRFEAWEDEDNSIAAPEPGLVAVRDSAVQPAEAWLAIDSGPSEPSPWPAATTTPVAEPVASAVSHPVAAPVSRPFSVPASQPLRPAPPVGAWEQAAGGAAASVWPVSTTQPNSRQPTSPQPTAPQPTSPQPLAPASAVPWLGSPQPAADQAPPHGAWGAAIEASPALPVEESASLEESGPRVHIVADGDTLDRIAARYLGSAARSSDLFAWNRGTLSHPDLLPIGVELKLEGPAGGVPASPISRSSGSAAGLVPVSNPAPGYSANPRAELLGPQPAGLAGF